MLERRTGNLTAQNKAYYSVQKWGQVTIRYVDDATFAYTFGQWIPFEKIGRPYRGIFAWDGFVLNYIGRNLLESITEKRHPLAHFRAKGGGYVWKGLLKEVSSLGAPVIITTSIGYHLVAFAMKQGPILIGSDYRALHLLGKILLEPALNNPLINTLGYTSILIGRKLGMTVWERKIPSQFYYDKDEGKPFLIQIAGQYTYRLLSDLNITFAMLFYLNYAGYQGATENSHIQWMMLLGSDMARQLAQYFAFTPSPINAIAPQRKLIFKDSLFEDEEDENIAQLMKKRGNSKQAILKWSAIKTTSALGLIAATYAMQSLCCRMITPDSCQADKEQSSYTTARFVITLGVPLAADFVLRHTRVGKVIKSIGGAAIDTISNSYFALFSSKYKAYHQVMNIDDPRLDVHQDFSP